jgi:hypothetical protein
MVLADAIITSAVRRLMMDMVLFSVDFQVLDCQRQAKPVLVRFSRKERCSGYHP